MTTETLDFDTLVAAARAQIPGYCPEWTDHNPSDPGIAMIELAATFVEMLLFQADQVTESTRLAFLRLLEGPDYVLPESGDVEAAIDAAVRRLREPFRAITPDDFAELLRTQWPQTPAALALGERARVARMHTLPQTDLETPGAKSPAPGHFSVLIVPPGAAPRPAPDPALLAGLRAFFDERRLLTVHTHLVGPGYLRVGVKAHLYADDDTDERGLDARAREAMKELFTPQGWPFGRSVYASDVLSRLDKVPGVDFVEQLQLTTETPARLVQDQGETVAVRLLAHELVDFDPALTTFTVYSRAGGTWIKLNP